MVGVMEEKYGKANRIWVLDRGMVSEENLEFMRSSSARYLVGTPRSLLRKFERLLDGHWEKVRPGVEVCLVPSPEGDDETFVLCRSEGRREKENAILNRFASALERKLDKLKERADAGKLRDRQKVERQIGRLLERHSRASSLFSVTVREKKNRLSLVITKHEERYQWVLETGGSYILRTNWTETDPKTLWYTYIQLTEVEDAFRTAKHDLGMRPIFHQKQDRTQAHILVCFLSLTLWRTLQQWMKTAGTEKTHGGDARGQIPGRTLAGKRQNHQNTRGSHARTGAQGPVTKNETPAPEQTEDHRKCSGENRPGFAVTVRNDSYRNLKLRKMG